MACDASRPRLGRGIFAALACALVLLSAVIAPGRAQAETCGDYTFVSFGKMAVITQYNGKDAEVVVPASLYDCTVVSIGENAFSGKTAITSVTIPEGVRQMSAFAFSGCTSLTSVSLPSSLRTIAAACFSGCNSLKSIDIPDGVTNMGQNVFDNCASLQSVSLPSGLKTLPASMFRNCFALQSVSIPQGVTSIGSYAFYKCMSLTSISIPQSVTSIGDYAFSEAYRLSSIALPDGLTGLGKAAFSNCQQLTSVRIPDGVKALGDSAFDTCVSLSSVELGSGLASIGEKAFANCMSLKEIALPDGLETIGERAFYGCKYLMQVNVGPSITSIGTDAFEYCAMRMAFYGPHTQAVHDCAKAYNKSEYHTVTFEANGGPEFASVQVLCGKTVSEPETPTRVNWFFNGWFADAAFSSEFDFTAPVVDDVTVYACWIQNVPPTSFDDVAQGTWYYNWVTAAAQVGIMNGYKDDRGLYTGHFGTDDLLTRGQAAVLIWRLMGEEEPTIDDVPFSDVSKDDYYYEAVAWCYERGYITGYTGTELFRPKAFVNREEFALIAYRVAKASGVDMTGFSTSNFDRCADCDAVCSWAREASEWCAAAYVITGKEVREGGYRLDPHEGTTRAQAAKIIVRLGMIVFGEADPYEPMDGLFASWQSDESAVTYDEVTFDDVEGLADVAAEETATGGVSQLAGQDAVESADAASSQVQASTVQPESGDAGQGAAESDATFADADQAQTTGGAVGESEVVPSLDEVSAVEVEDDASLGEPSLGEADTAPDEALDEAA